ncbi:MAG TPA: 2-dehydropantoate 2-reductase [Bradyrhizobium sp.]|uniref:ketopantoate reductase family protein n=1 Tax=Bradyrhizobium sp. TaxID=376 RepID=UPI002CBACA3A|nr:2-dehydropantoate 2-reductase [Bradyrhizobium sp.]HLZ03412.1 2-dehydropantoate 2-reductase [Bradyrhizobium sp.]
MKVAVIGAGAMGCLFGGRLAQAGHEVVLVDASQPQIDALNERGLLLTDDNGTSRIKIQAAGAAELSGVRELLIFFTKAMHTAAAARDAKHLFGPQSWALTVQNGIGNDDAIAAHVGRERLVVGMTNYSADLVGLGQVTTQGFGEIRIWAAEQPGPRVSEIATCLNDAGLVCRADPNVWTAIWEKVTFNAAMNAVAAITRLPVGGFAENPDARHLLGRIVEEGSAVALAAGHAIDPANVWAVIDAAFAAHRRHKPSMLQDILAGRLTEIDAINGAIVLQGRARGVPTPYNDALASLVRIIERSAEGTSVAPADASPIKR